MKLTEQQTISKRELRDDATLLELWSQSHETSVELAEAIMDRAVETDREPDTIWQDPTAEDIEDVLDTVRRRYPELEEVHWGEETFRVTADPR